MGTEQLQALFREHRTAVLGAAGAGVVGMALLQRKKKATTPAGAGAAGSPAGTMPAAGIAVPAGAVQGTFPNTTESDVYNSIMDQLLQQQASMTSTSPAPATAPKPIASTLFAPSDSRQFVLYGDGTVTQLQSDGSQLGLNWSQWQPLAAQYSPTVAGQLHPGGAYFETTGNLNRVAGGTAG
jgi:hypothetical protein